MFSMGSKFAYYRNVAGGQRSSSISAKSWRFRITSFAAILFAVAVAVIAPSTRAATPIPQLYAAPYFNISTYPYGGNPASSVGGAIAKWWPAYVAYWGMPNCSYNVISFSDGPTTGLFAKAPVFNGCGGTETFKGTLQCPSGYQLVSSQCQPNGQPVPDKNRGCGGQPLDCSRNGSNPVNSANGNKHELETDYEGAGPFPLEIRRIYNSSSTAVGLFGSNWRSTYERRLAVSSTLVIAQRASGNEFYFVPSGANWVSDNDVRERLTKDATGYTLTTPEGATERYDLTGENFCP